MLNMYTKKGRNVDILYNTAKRILWEVFLLENIPHFTLKKLFPETSLSTCTSVVGNRGPRFLVHHRGKFSNQFFCNALNVDFYAREWMSAMHDVVVAVKRGLR